MKIDKLRLVAAARMYWKAIRDVCKMQKAVFRNTCEDP